MHKSTYFRKLPSIDLIKNNAILQQKTIGIPDWLIVRTAQSVLSEFRQIIQNSNFDELDKLDLSLEKIINKITIELNNINEKTLKKVINATGIVIHTNLGRSLLNKNVADKLYTIATNYTDLEMDLYSGKRSVRGDEVVSILKLLTNCEDAIIVNNNAAAVLLILSTFAKDKEVIVSRGEQVEVGGSFRIPDVMKSSGAKLIEVGTTNRTTFKDYEEAITDNTSLLMKIHSSNFKIVGFTEEPSLQELVELSHKYKIPFVHDLGSGSFIDFTKYNLPFEPLVQDSMKENVDILCFSGDKLLGASQAGIILGKKKYLDLIRKNQLLRALRVDKFTILCLTETLKMYLDYNKALKDIPTLKMLTMSYDKIVQRAKKLCNFINNLNVNIITSLIDDKSSCGGGAMPNSNMPTKIVALKSETLSANELSKKLRIGNNPIVCRVHNECIFLDTRTIDENDFEIIANKLKDICGVKE